MTKGKCLLCGENLKEGEDVKTVELKNGKVFSAHQDCLTALQKLTEQRIELPPREEMSSKDLIYQFYLEGWFSTPKTLSEVENKLQQSGFNYALSTISHNLKDLTQRGILTRQGKRGSYEYIQKKPPQGT